MIKITKYSQQKTIQTILFNMSYLWFSSGNIYIYENFIKNIYYIINEEDKDITFMKDISDSKITEYNLKYNNGKDIIDATTFLRIVKLKRLLNDDKNN